MRLLTKFIIMKKLLSLLTLVLVQFGMFAQSTYTDTSTAGVTFVYSLNETDKTATLTSVTLTETVATVNIPYEITYSGFKYSVTTIGEGAIGSNITDLKILKDTVDNTIINIHADAFVNATSLTTFTIVRDVVIDGTSPLAKAVNLKTISVSRTNLQANLVAGCSQITKLELQAAIRTIEAGAFKGLSGLTELWCMYTTPPAIDADALSDIDLDNCKLFVAYASGTVAAYRAADGWCLFRRISNYDDNELDILPTVATSLDQTNVALQIDEICQLVCTVKQMPHNGAETTVTNPTLTWSSTDESVATVDENGLVTAIANGSATITVAYTNYRTYTATAEIEVEAANPVVEMVLNPASLTLTKGNAGQFACSVTEDGVAVETPALTWSSSNINVASVDELGLVTAISEGTTTITATYTAAHGTYTVTADVTVTIPNVVVTLSPSAISLTEGETSQLTCAVVVDDVNVELPKLTWTSADESIASVDELGAVTANSVGSTTITATYETTHGEYTATAEVEVTSSEEPEPENLALILKMPNGTIELPDAADRETNLRFVADAGYLINSVTIDGEDVTEEVVNNNGNFTVAQVVGSSSTISVVFVKKAVSEANAINAMTIKVKAYNGAIAIDGASSGAEAQLFDAAGRLILSTTDNRIATDYRGVAILTVDGQVFKFCL